MTYQELTNIIESIESNKKELENLLNYSTNYLSSFSKKPIPKHIATIINLLKIMHNNKIDWKNELKNMDISKNIHKGGKFEIKSH